MRISVLVPSRGRPAQLAASAASLRSLAEDPGGIEVLVAADPGDHATIEAAAGIADAVLVTPVRHGYHALNEYYNALAKIANGDWLLVWNDDARMLTRGWDTVVSASRPAVLWLQANHAQNSNVFPAFPAAWARAMGHVSPYAHVDTYLQRIGTLLGRHDRVPVRVLHDRPDVTGCAPDDTYREGRALLGPQGTAGAFPHDLYMADAKIVRALLQGAGQDQNLVAQQLA